MNVFGMDTLPQVITAIGGVGTAAFGLVDASKVFGGSVNHLGFRRIRSVIARLFPANVGGGNAIPLSDLVGTLQSNWFNGIDLASQKAIAKSLIKLDLSPTTATHLAQATGVDPTALVQVATNIATSTPLSAAETDVYGRFDLIVTALLDQAYQRADHDYRNGTRASAMVVAILFSLAAAQLIANGTGASANFGAAFLIGLLATPLAPIAKDLSTALATAVNTLQLVKK